MLSFMRVPPRSFAPAERQVAILPRPIFTHDV
jgi:hypothetical protein